MFRNEQRIQVDQFNNSLVAERNKAAAEQTALQNELKKTSEQFTAQKTQAEYGMQVYEYILVFIVEWI